MKTVNSYLEALSDGWYSLGLSDIHIKIGSFEIRIHKKGRRPHWVQVANNEIKRVRL